DEHERIEEVRCFLHERQRVEECEQDDRACERTHGCAERIDVERDADRKPAARLPAAEPVHDLVAPALEAQHDPEREGACRRGDPDRILRDPGQHAVGRDDERSADEWHCDGQRDEPVHPLSSWISSGSSVPASFCTSSASARISASTVTLTTMSVSTRDCTTGSTAVVPSLTPLKIGGPPP